MKKLMCIILLLYSFSCISYATVGIVPQGRVLPSGQMDQKTLVNITRTEFISFLEQGTIPTGINPKNIYYPAWVTNSSIRKKFARELSGYLCKRLGGITMDSLLALARDTVLTPIEYLQPGEMVYSNGINLKTFRLETAPVRKARKTATGEMEQKMTFPGGVEVYLTCLNGDVLDKETLGQEEGIPIDDTLQILHNPAPVCYIDTGTVTVNRFYENQLLPKDPAVVIHTQPKTILYGKDTIINEYHVSYQKPPRDTVYIAPECDCNQRKQPEFVDYDPTNQVGGTCLSSSTAYYSPQNQSGGSCTAGATVTVRTTKNINGVVTSNTQQYYGNSVQHTTNVGSNSNISTNSTPSGVVSDNYNF